MVKLRNRLKGWRLRRYVTVAFVIVMIVSIALVLPWRWLAPPTTSFMLQVQFHHKDDIHQQWVPLSEISPALPIAVVASEDQKFPSHHGFDFESISAALQEDRQRRRGASTITQQLAKNLYLWSGRSLFRKAVEAYFTVLIEFSWPKRRILEVYLNVVEFGPKVYGVGAASRMFFGKSPKQITSQEAAILAAVLPNPKRMSAHHPSEYVRMRASEIEAAVRALGGPVYLADL